NPGGGFAPPTRLAGEHLRPLGHPSRAASVRQRPTGTRVATRGREPPARASPARPTSLVARRWEGRGGGWPQPVNRGAATIGPATRVVTVRRAEPWPLGWVFVPAFRLTFVAVVVADAAPPPAPTPPGAAEGGRYRRPDGPRGGPGAGRGRPAADAGRQA